MSMPESESAAVVIARGDLGRMRELRELLAKAGVASEFVSPDTAARRG